MSDRKKILIVEDDPDLIRALGMRLRSAGYEVSQAVDGATAAQIAIREKPDLVILDIGLPAGDGHVVAGRLRSNVKTMSVPVIYLTARATPEDMAKASEAGAAGYVLKPFKPERLLALVERVLAGGPAPGDPHAR